MTDPAREAYERWMFDHRRILDKLRRIERVEQTILAEMGCPTDPAQIYDALDRQALPRKHRDRAKYAMYTLIHIQMVRSHLGPLAPNAALAAEAALLVGALAGDAAIAHVRHAAVLSGSKLGGRARGQQIADAARTRDRDIARYAKRWHASDELQEEYRTASAYVRKMTGLQPWAIQRALRRLTRTSRK